MEEMTRTTMTDMLDSCVDRLRGVRSILIALGSDLQEKDALGLLAEVVERVADDVDEVRSAIDPYEAPGGSAGSRAPGKNATDQGLQFPQGS